MRTFTNLTLSICLLTGSALSAQVAYFGFQFSAAEPQGDLRDSVKTAGATLGVFIPIDLGRGHLLRPRADYGYWRGPKPGDGIGLSPGRRYADGKAFSLGVDYLYHPSEGRLGFYGLAGGGFQQSSIEGTRNPYEPMSAHSDRVLGSGGAAYWSAGLGWQFNPLFGMELRTTRSNPTIEGTKYAFTSVQLSFTFQF